MSKLAIMAAAPKIAKAQPKTAAGVVSLFRTFLPLLPIVFGEILRADKTGRYRKPLRAIRDFLNASDLGGIE